MTHCITVIQFFTTQSSRFFLGGLLMSFGSIAYASLDSEHQWAIAGGELIMELNSGVLSPLNIQVDTEGMAEARAPEEHLGYWRIAMPADSGASMTVRAPNYAIEAFEGGRLRYVDGFVLHFPKGSVDLREFEIRPRDDHHAEFDLVDRDGIAWARLDQAHYELMDEGQALELRHMNLIMNDNLAALTGIAGLSGQALGRVHLRAPVISTPDVTEPLGQCSDPEWPGDRETFADVALIAMDRPGANGVQFFRCQGCNGSSGGPIVFAPDAKLANEGTADVPWWFQFTGPFPPYGNDQHPFLIWNLYRIDNAGRLEQIGVSGVKHAFFTVNTDCSCPGGNILWTGCTDTYSSSNNDAGGFLGPRSEIVPADGQWGRCHSFFDPDCLASQMQSSTPFQNRMLVLEEDLSVNNHSGATYLMEAWYVVRDDVNIFNTMGWREFSTTWNGATWPATLLGDFTQGPVIDNWVDPANPEPGQMNTLVDTPDGRIKVAVQTKDLGNGTWRYDYALANFDFMRAVTEGSEPNVEVISNIGLVGVAVPVLSSTVVTEISFARANRTKGQDWTATRNDVAVQWSDEADTPLDWGSLYRFSLIADSEPVESEMVLTAGDGVPLHFSAATLAPSAPIQVFEDRFESE